MIGISEIKSVKYYCKQTASAFQKRIDAPGGTDDDRKAAEEYAAVADMLEKATPEALYLLFDTGIFNEIVKGYATTAASFAGLTGGAIDSIRDGVREALGDFSAEAMERKELER